MGMKSSVLIYETKSSSCNKIVVAIFAIITVFEDKHHQHCENTIIYTT